MFPSSSYDANRFISDDAATINEVDASYTTLEYGRERGMERAGRWASSETSGIHSSRLGPWVSRSQLWAGAAPWLHKQKHAPPPSRAGNRLWTPTGSMS